MADTIVTLSGDDAQLLRSFQRLIAKENDFRGSLQQTERTSRKTHDSQVADAARLERENKRAADAIYREHAKLLEQRESKARKAALEEAALARQTAIKEVQAAIQAADAEIAATQKVIDKKRELAGAATSSGQASTNALLGQVSIAAALGTSIHAAASAWRAFKAARDEALKSGQTIEDENSRLLQISDSLEDLQAMQNRADRTSRETGVPRDVSRRILFSAKSEGFDQAYEAVMGSSDVINPESAAIVAGKVPALFQKSIAPMEAVDLTLRAAKESNLNFEQMASSLPQAAEGGAIAKASPEELLATQSVLAQRFKSGDTAADRIKAFASTTGIDERFAGMGIIKAVKSIDAMSEDERKEFLGKSQELNAAFVIMKEEMPTIEKRFKELQEERKAFNEGGGMLRKQISIAAADPVMSSRRKMRQAEVSKEIERERSLQQGAIEEKTVVSSAGAILERKQPSLMNRLFTNTFSGVLGAFGADESGMVANMYADSLEAGLLGGVTGNLTNRGPLSLVGKTTRAFMDIKSEREQTRADIETSFRSIPSSTPTPDAMLAEQSKRTADASERTAAAIERQNQLVEAQTRAIDGLKVPPNNPQAIRAMQDGPNAR